MPRPRFTVKVLFAIVAVAAILLAVWRGLAHAGFTLPPDAARVTLDYGSHDPDQVIIVAHRKDGDVPLRSYYRKVYYFKPDFPGLSSRYSEWVSAESYSLVTRDRTTAWRIWLLSDSQVSIEGGPWPLSERAVTISIPNEADATTPTTDYLRQLGLRDEVITGEW